MRKNRLPPRRNLQHLPVIKRRGDGIPFPLLQRRKSKSQDNESFGERKRKDSEGNRKGVCSAQITQSANLARNDLNKQE